MILHLIRHPRPLIAKGVCYGQLDIEAENPETLLPGLRAQLPAGLPLWSSPLRRCRALAEALHRAPEFDARLMELDFGDWEGRPWDDIPRPALDAWAADLTGFAPPGGESADMLRARLVDFLADCAVPEAVLVTHAGVIRQLHAEAEQVPLAALLTRPVAYGGYSLCRIPEFSPRR